MPDNNKLIKNRPWMVILIIIIAGISAALLTGINIYTKPRIALNEEIKLKKSVLDVFGIVYERHNIIDIFNERIKIKDIGKTPFYEYYDKERLIGVAFEMKGPGFWGPIYALAALRPDLKSIIGIEILRQEETPGLGGRITEDEFKEQFKGRAVEPQIRVDGITGATMTSKAFKQIINENVRSFREKFEEKG